MCFEGAAGEGIGGYIRFGKEEGATVAAQARLPVDPACRGGFFVAPTLLTGVTRDTRVFKEETYGPVVTVTTFEGEEEVVALTNSSHYGLASVVFTRNAERSRRFPRQIDLGYGLDQRLF